MKNPPTKQSLILTFGYGNRSSYDSLLAYIKEFKVDFLIDVREKPRAWSRKWYGDQLEKFCHVKRQNPYTEKTTLNPTDRKFSDPTPQTSQLFRSPNNSPLAT